jgi:dTDP-4-amino-4,6-dideoxygalactose transaminase
MFYIQCRNLEDRTCLIAHLKKSQINAVFHYLSLHKSPFYESKHDGRVLPITDFYSDTLLRLPMYYELSEADIEQITKFIYEYFENN